MLRFRGGKKCLDPCNNLPWLGFSGRIEVSSPRVVDRGYLNQYFKNRTGPVGSIGQVVD